MIINNLEVSRSSQAYNRTSEVTEKLMETEGDLIHKYIYAPIMEKHFASQKVRSFVADVAVRAGGLLCSIFNIFYRILALPAIYLYFLLIAPSVQPTLLYEGIEEEDDTAYSTDISDGGSELRPIRLHLPEDDEDLARSTGL